MTTAEQWASLGVAPPTPTGESQHFWDSAAEGRLVLQRCARCGTHQGYPRRRCVRCWSDELPWVEATGRGRLVTHSEVHRPGQASWAAVAPYYVGLVRLDEGAVLLTHLLTDGTTPRVGDPCRVEMTVVGDYTLPFFRTDQTENRQPVS